jgi:hypothetical protein
LTRRIRDVAQVDDSIEIVRDPERRSQPFVERRRIARRARHIRRLRDEDDEA